MSNIIKSKFIKGIWFIEAPLEANNFDITDAESFYGNFITSTLDIKGALLQFTKEEFRNCAAYYSPDTFYCLQKNNIKNPKGLFLTKLATEDDWIRLLEYKDPIGYFLYDKLTTNIGSCWLDSYNTTKKATESGLSLLKAENLDSNKNWLIIKEEI